MNISQVIDRLWPEPDYGDFLAPERPEDYFEADDAVWYFPLEDNYDVIFEAFVEEVDYSDRTARIAFFNPALDDWQEHWCGIDALLLDDLYPYNATQNATAA